MGPPARTPGKDQDWVENVFQEEREATPGRVFPPPTAPATHPKYPVNTQLKSQAWFMGLRTNIHSTHVHISSRHVSHVPQAHVRTECQ